MPIVRRTHAGSSDSALHQDPEAKKGTGNSGQYRGFWTAASVLFLVCVTLHLMQENIYLEDALQDQSYAVEGCHKDLEEQLKIVNSLEESLVNVGDLKQANSLSALLTGPQGAASSPYRLADVLQLPGSPSPDQVISAFQNKWSLDNIPLYSRCGVVASRSLPAPLKQRPTCSIAVISSWSPRFCGIATYSSKLVEGFESRCPHGSKIDVVAVRNPGEAADFFSNESKVKKSFRKGVGTDYDAAAEYINSERYDIVVLSYEFGIFGDEFVMCLLKQIREALVISVLHTVAENLPWQKQALTEQVVMLSHKVVVMTETMKREVDWLHQVPQHLVRVIPHGVPGPLSSMEGEKHSWSFGSDKVLFSNGLLHQGKGIEHVIAAMPAVLEAHPEAKYVVQGAPHPTGEGTEEYYGMLQGAVKRLHLENSVLFYPDFLSDSELLAELSGSSVFINAYVDRVASVSGTLIMAMGAGVPCVSTPYPFAKEMMAGQSGLLVPFADSSSIARAVVYLLSNPDRATAIGIRAKKKTHTWDAVASMFLNLAFEQV